MWLPVRQQAGSSIGEISGLSSSRLLVRAVPRSVPKLAASLAYTPGAKFWIGLRAKSLSLLACCQPPCAGESRGDRCIFVRPGIRPQVSPSFTARVPAETPSRLVALGKFGYFYPAFGRFGAERVDRLHHDNNWLLRSRALNGSEPRRLRSHFSLAALRP
jgi:hypothetical protein